MLQALAIKYRPKTFDELIGQDTVSASLKYALNHDRLAHAYLFSGLRGSGKTSSARIFSRALVCEKGPSATPCGECKQCQAALFGKHIDIIELDAASHRGLEDIQDLIEQTKYAPSMARFKIFIIDEVHMLTPQAANALLKTLEEPPSYVKFVLATTDPLKLPATVLSRTQHFRFKQIPQSEVLAHLEGILQKEGVKFEPEALKLLSRSGQGSLRDTLTLLDQAIIYSHSDITAAKIAQMLGFLDPEQIKSFYTLIIAQDRARVLEFLKELQDYEASSVIDEMIFYLKERFFEKSGEFSMLLYERFFRILSRAKTMLANCDDNAFVLCVMAFMMIEAGRLKHIDEAIDEEQRAFGGVSSGANGGNLGGSVNLKNATATKNAENSSNGVNLNSASAENSPNLAKNSQNSAQNSVNLAVNSAHAQNAANSAFSAAQTAPKPEFNAYERLKAAIYERDFTLGECFEKNTAFVSFEKNELKISSNAENEADRNTLNKGFKLILQLASQTLGENVKIAVQKEPKIDESKLQDIKKPAKDLKSSFERLKSGAKKQDDTAETLKALNDYFGEPKKA